ncbi:hypothetical protein E2P81_ATG00796 [Venturia nashicola]|uniref:Uncharacterized protein n=1 Tax=Venturia nashicola TaxID=86259 RepID=A0A4Z1PKD6_9PEZI|nr:hypothetical protein E6O75_ATG00814 [Venturia nashicola]TLD38253.1 hypothetical protein E2P81_ATG00796 [Venturia nashicola]
MRMLAAADPSPPPRLPVQAATPELSTWSRLRSDRCQSLSLEYHHLVIEQRLDAVAWEIEPFTSVVAGIGMIQPPVQTGSTRWMGRWSAEVDLIHTEYHSSLRSG